MRRQAIRILRSLRRALKAELPEARTLTLDVTVDAQRYRATLTRGDEGIAEVEGTTAPDAYFGLGYAMARDRFFQMDLWRRLSFGTFSSFIGDLPLPTEAQLFGAKRLSDLDLFLRSFRCENDARMEADAMHGARREELVAFVAGVNHWLETTDALPPEYAFVAGPVRWELKDTLGLAMSCGLLLDLAGLDHEYIVNALLAEGHSSLAAALYQEADLPIPDVHAASGRGPFVPLVPVTGGGSNGWVVSGARSASGAPILANDPHLPISPLPGFWYQVAMRCDEFRVEGLTMAGTPSFAIGQNGHAAWGATAAQRDAFDTFRTRLSADGSSWLSESGWQPIEYVDVEIKRRLGPPRRERMPVCEYGTIFPTWRAWDGSSLCLRFAGAGHMATMQRASGQQWFEGMARILRSRSWEDHREGLRGMSAGGVAIHHLYADRDGHIAHQMYGLYPERSDGQGVVPRATWEAKSNWQGYVPFDRLPCEVDPKRGYCASANASPEHEIGGLWPYLASVYEPTYRYDAIAERLTAEEAHTVEASRKLQCETRSGPALLFRDAIVESYVGTRGVAAEVIAQLRAWDGRYELDNAAAPVVELTMRSAALHFWQAVLGEELGKRFAMSRFHLRRFVELVTTKTDPLWQIATDKEVEVANLIADAFAATCRELEQTQGKDPSDWTLEAVQQVHLKHPLGVLPLLGRLFDIGSFPSPGAEFTPLAISSTANGAKLDSAIGPVSRFVCDLAEPERGYWAHASGVSGVPGSPWYANTTERWLRGDLYERKLRS